jgi:ubiquinone/menaquinone biosynthesis C-methylase UbiE
MVQMDITDIHYPDNSFDVIYCSHVLVLLCYKIKQIQEITRASAILKVR